MLDQKGAGSNPGSLICEESDEKVTNKQESYPQAVGNLLVKWMKASPDADDASSFEGAKSESYPHFCG